MPSLAVMNFDDDFTAASVVPDAARWKLTRRGDLEVGVTISPSRSPEDVFLARLLWLDYPGPRPASVKFVDPETGRLDNPKAWPKANGFRPTALDICANWTAEGFALHPEWERTEHRWRAGGNEILKIMRIFQNELDTSYTGRFNG